MRHPSSQAPRRLAARSARLAGHAALVAVAALLLASAGACGDDDGSGTTPPPPPGDTGPEADGGPVDSGPDARDDAAALDSGPADAGPPPGVPDRYCPGSDGCMDDGDGVLQVGAAAVAVTPHITPTTDVQTVDTNSDGEFNPEDGDEGDVPSIAES